MNSIVHSQQKDLYILSSIVPILDKNLEESIVEKVNGYMVPLTKFKKNLSLIDSINTFGKVDSIYLPQIAYLKNISLIRSDAVECLDNCYLQYIPFLENGKCFMQVIYIENSLHTTEPSFTTDVKRNTDNEVSRYIYEIDDDENLIFMDNFLLTRAYFLSKTVNNLDEIKRPKSRWI